MNLKNAFRPSLLLSQTHFQNRFKEGIIASAVERIADENFYKTIEIDIIYDYRDRKRIRNVVHSHNIVATQWLTTILLNENLNLSAVDESVRRKSVLRLTSFFDKACECGVKNIAVLSGADPGPKLRKEAIENLFVSLCELLEVLSKYKGMQLLIEPLDRGAHKNFLIGPTDESISLLNRLLKVYKNIGIVWDSAHMALCGEDIENSFLKSSSYIKGIHLSNAILNKNHIKYGDYHMPIGGPGFLTIEKISSLFSKAIEVGLFYKKKPDVAVEIQTQVGENPWDTVAKCRKILEEAWIKLNYLKEQNED